MSRIRGYYPGGPGREPRRDAPGERLVDVATRWSRGTEQVVRARGVRRRRRLAGGFALILLAAVTLGGWLGVRSHASAEEVAREAEAAAVPDTPDARVRQEADRVLQELWRMEALERSP